MPLFKIAWTESHYGWAIWRITESEKEFHDLVNLDACPDEVHRSDKRLEWLAARALLKLLLERTGLSYQGLRKDGFGKPFLEGYSYPISLSHSYPYVAVQLDKRSLVGIDVEQPKTKLLRIAPRVLNATEQHDAGNDPVKNCVYWCAKEALYKIYGRRGLTFSEHLHVDPFVLQRNGGLTGTISTAASDRLINLEYSIEEDFVLVYTKTD